MRTKIEGVGPRILNFCFFVQLKYQLVKEFAEVDVRIIQSFGNLENGDQNTLKFQFWAVLISSKIDEQRRV